VIDPRFDQALTPERFRSLLDRAVAPLDTGHVAAVDSTKRLYRPRALHDNPRAISSRWPSAVARIYRILQGVAQSSDFERAVNGAEYPDLAKQYAETWIFYMTRTKPGPPNKVDHNPFRNLTDTDAMRKFIRLVEDICDRSTGKLGAWCTK